MIAISKNQLLIVILTIFSQIGYAQDEKDLQDNKSLYQKLGFYDLRGTSAVDTGFGTSLITSDYPEPEFDFYFRIGFKQYITEYLNVGLTYNKYNLAFNDTFNEGYMSFDLNLECLILPYDEFSPFIFGGYGYNASNDFENTQTKLQVGVGLEYIVVDGVGVKLFGDYNYTLSNELEGLIAPNTDESFIRVAFGINVYFGGNKKRERLLENVKTVINSNLIK
ncbi:Curli production assembly/transport component CsgG [Winogradskyella sp.]|uniref:Curli production assembly/transport component CsgG n=1 Tax=Winogradskyella sp. TaxID=1883156 RepID=UPI002633BDEB|nr:Curli production assembly/transport component CsgG [Winogradskyella sp.]